MTDHLIFTPNRLNVPCAECGQFCDPHLCGLVAYCKACCGVCSPAADGRTGAVAGLVGTQGMLL